MSDLIEMVDAQVIFLWPPLTWAVVDSNHGEGNGTPLQYSCLENPWMEEPGRLQSMGLLQVRHDWVTSLSLFSFVYWRGKWQPTPVFLPGESQGRGSLVGCRLWGRTASDTTEVTQWQQQQQQTVTKHVKGSSLLVSTTFLSFKVTWMHMVCVCVCVCAECPTENPNQFPLEFSPSYPQL